MKYMLHLLLICILLTACQTTESTTEKEYTIYSVRQDGMALESAEYDPTATDIEDLIEELLGQMKPLEKEVYPNKIQLVDGFVYLDYQLNYLRLNATEEVLYRAGIVKNLTQIEGIEGVYFLLDGNPLKDQKGQAIGVLTGDSFVTNTGNTISALSRETVKLYFSNEEGNALKPEVIELVYNGNASMEKLILEQLIAGPRAEGYYATLPEELKVLSVSVTDGTCFVNFDQKLSEFTEDITEDVRLYSIVNSLTELNTIQSVQISINGNRETNLRDSYPLNKIYERNLELIIQE